MKMKVAMPETLGLLLISFIALMVGLIALGIGEAANQMEMVVFFLPYAAILLGIVTVFSYWNDNMFATALFGVLAVFFWGFPAVMLGAFATDASLYVLFGAVFLLVMAFVSTAQPVRMVSGVILLAGLTFLFLSVWVYDGFVVDAIWGILVGIFGVLAGLLAMYVPVAILYNSMKGQNTFPLM